MTDFFTTSGAGGLGAVIGVVASFFGFRVKINGMEKRLDRMADSVVYHEPCGARHEGIEKRFDTQELMLKEIRDDIKILIGK